MVQIKYKTGTGVGNPHPTSFLSLSILELWRDARQKRVVKRISSPPHSPACLSLRCARIFSVAHPSTVRRTFPHPTSFLVQHPSCFLSLSLSQILSPHPTCFTNKPFVDSFATSMSVQHTILRGSRRLVGSLNC